MKTENILTTEKYDHLTSIKSMYLLVNFQHFYFNTVQIMPVIKILIIPNAEGLSQVQQELGN
jgi:hypothetical protein